MRLGSGDLFSYLKKYKIVLLGLVTLGISSFLALQFYSTETSPTSKSVVSKPAVPKPVVKAPEVVKPEPVVQVQPDKAQSQLSPSNPAFNNGIAPITQKQRKQDRRRSRYRNHDAEVRRSFVNSKMLYARSLEDFLQKLTSPLVQNNIDKIDSDYIKEKGLQQIVRRRASSISVAIAGALRYDYNTDNKVTTEELTQVRKKSTSGTFIGSQEVENTLIKSVEKMDLNKDGSVTIDEMVQSSDNRTKAMHSGQSLDYHSKTLVSLLELDSDGDNVVTVDELKKVGTALYNAVDTDGDKMLSHAEKETYISKQAKILKDKENAKLKKSLKIKGNEELHIVSVYEGYVSQNGDNTVSGDHVDVVVDRPGKDVILLLSSYRPVKWNIKTLNNTKVRYFMAASKSKNYSKVFENDSQVEFKEVILRDHIAYDMNNRKFSRSKREVKETIGLDIASFSGEYKAKKEGFVVNGVANDKQLEVKALKVNYGNITLPTRSFIGNINGAVGQYNVKGELVKSLPQTFRRDNPKHILYVKDKKQYYHVRPNGLKIYDDQGVLLEEAVIDVTQVPQIRNRIAGITYDRKNDRIVFLCPSHGESYLFLYSLATKKWSAVNFTKGFFSGLDYDESGDRFITVKQSTTPPYEGDEDVTLLSFDAQGNTIKEDIITADSLLGYREVDDGIFTKVGIVVQNNQIILSVAGNMRGRVTRGAVNRIYVYDENSRKSYLTWFLEN